MAQGLSLSALFGVLVIGLSNPGVAQQLQGCEQHAAMIKKLDREFHELRVAVAMNQYGWLIELFEADDGKTWTLVGTRPNGPACVFGVGNDWQNVAPALGHPS